MRLDYEMVDSNIFKLQCIPSRLRFHFSFGKPRKKISEFQGHKKNLWLSLLVEAEKLEKIRHDDSIFINVSSTIVWTNSDLGIGGFSNKFGQYDHYHSQKYWWKINTSRRILTGFSAIVFAYSKVLFRGPLPHHVYHKALSLLLFWFWKVANTIARRSLMFQWSILIGMIGKSHTMVDIKYLNM